MADSLALPYPVEMTNPVAAVKSYGPYYDRYQAQAAVPQGIRHPGLTVFLVDHAAEWWWPGPDLSDDALVAKGGGVPDAVTQTIASLGAPIQAWFASGARQDFPNLQAAANALSTGGGGVVVSCAEQVVTAPLLLPHLVSIWAPHTTLRVTSGTYGDALTKYGTGNVCLRLVERSGAGTGYGAVFNNATGVLRADLTCSRGYNALFKTGGSLEYFGNVFFNPLAPGAGAGEHIAVLNNGGYLRTEGRIVTDTDLPNAEAIVSFSPGAVFDCRSSVEVRSQGYAGRVQNAQLDVHQPITSHGGGLRFQSLGQLNLYAPVDTRQSGYAGQFAAPLRLIQNVLFNAAQHHVTLWPGHALLAPPLVPSMANQNASSAQYVKLVGPAGWNGGLEPGVVVLNQTALPAAVSADTLVWLAADNPDGFQRNKVTNTNLDYTSAVRITPNALNGLPVSEWDNTDAKAPDGALGLMQQKTQPGTITLLLRCTSPANGDDSNPDGKKFISYPYDCDLCVNLSYVVTNAQSGSKLATGGEWAVVTLQMPYGPDGLVYLNGKYATKTGSRNYIYSPTYDGCIGFFGGFTGQVAEVLVTRDSSREAGRLHEQYLKLKYNLPF